MAALYLEYWMMFCSCFVGVCGLAMSADWNIILGLVFVTALSVQLEYDDVHLFLPQTPPEQAPRSDALQGQRRKTEITAAEQGLLRTN